MMKRRLKTNLTTLLLAGIIIQIPCIESQMNPCTDYPLDSTDERIIQAVESLYSYQDETGKIQGLSTSSWASMALSLVNRNDTRFQKLTHYLVTSTSQINFEKATDVERHILSLIACGINPENINSINLTEELLGLYDGTQIGDPANIYDDVFGIIALISLGLPEDTPTISQLKNTIISRQQNDGSWGDVDTTAAAIMALVSAGVSNQSSIFENALFFLHSHQDESGGFSSWDSVNIASTSWMVSALVSLDRDPCSEKWEQEKSSPITYILSLQQSNGLFNYTTTQSINSLWMTSYALIALCGKTFPVAIQESKSDPDDFPDDGSDEQQDSSDSIIRSRENRTLSDKTIHQEIRILHPHDQGIYFMNRKTRYYLDSLIVIGPIDLTVKIDEYVDKVVFYLNDICIGADCNPPFSITINQRFSLIKNTVTIKAIKYNKSYYQQDFGSYMPVIVDTVNKFLCEQNKGCYQNLTKLKQGMEQNHINKIYKTTLSMILLTIEIPQINRT